MQTENKRIAKNTLFLYVRMILLIGVNFFTTRIVLEALGIDDFGLYNVVAGFVALVTFINQSVTTSIQRFINYGIGKGDECEVKQYFQSSLLTQLILIVGLLMLAETVGLWFVNTQLVVAPDKLFALNVVYQASIATVLASIYRAAFNAVIIALEKMQFYAMLSLVEGFAQLGIAYTLLCVVSYRLELYAALLLALAIVVTVLYIVYAKKIMPSITLKPRYNKTHLIEISSFCGWNILGAGSGVVKSQGINTLMNMFFGVAINAARGIASQVLSCAFRLASNFQVAMYPQIIQSYAQGDRDRYFTLSYGCYKMSFYLMWLVTLPLVICTPAVLNLWLGNNVPPYTDLFIKIILLTGLVDSLGSAISTPIYATGNIKQYQIVVSSAILLVLPISWAVYKLGGSPESSMYISLFLSIIAQVLRVKIWCKLVAEKVRNYLFKIALPGCTILTVSTAATYFFSHIVAASIVGFLATVLFSVIINATLIFFVGLNKNEQTAALGFLKTVKKA